MEIVNKVAQSGLLTIDLEEWFPSQEIVEIDLAPILFQGMILREKDMRDFVSTLDLKLYENKLVCVFCSIDAIIPTWAFMLVAIQLSGVAQKTFFGKKQQLLETYYHDFISRLDIKQYIDAKIVIKGCSKLPVPDSAYLDIAAQLKPVAKSIMYGEPCSTVPLYKKPKQ
jgi:hypothetical protein